MIFYQLRHDLRLSGDAMVFKATLNFKVEVLFTYTIRMHSQMRIAESFVTIFSCFPGLQTSILH